MRTITTAPGIGDFLFVAQKLVTQEEKFDWMFPVNNPEAGASRSNVQTRAFQLERLLPSLINSTAHVRMKFERSIRGQSPPTWEAAKLYQNFFLEANSWVEGGNRIEGFLPDLKTSYTLPFETTRENKREAGEIIENIGGCKLCGIYTSNHAKSRESWLESEWVEMIGLIKKHDPRYKFVFIAAEYDRPLTEDVIKHFDKSDYVTCIDRDLGAVIEILKQLDIFISFQSGLSIIGELLPIKQTCMLYWNDRKHRNIIEAWPNPKRIASSEYKGCIFCPPQQIFDWLVKNNKL